MTLRPRGDRRPTSFARGFCKASRAKKRDSRTPLDRHGCRYSPIAQEQLNHNRKGRPFPFSARPPNVDNVNFQCNSHERLYRDAYPRATDRRGRREKSSTAFLHEYLRRERYPFAHRRDELSKADRHRHHLYRSIPGSDHVHSRSTARREVQGVQVLRREREEKKKNDAK